MEVRNEGERGDYFVMDEDAANQCDTEPASIRCPPPFFYPYARFSFAKLIPLHPGLLLSNRLNANLVLHLERRIMPVPVSSLTLEIVERRIREIWTVDDPAVLSTPPMEYQIVDE